MIKICYTQTPTPNFIMLCKLLDAELNYRVGGYQNRQQYEHLNSLDNIHDFYTAYINEEAAGCACFKKLAPFSLEIKRVFVKKGVRNNGIAKAILRKIIDDAINQRFHTLFLETGNVLPEAIELYKSLGFYIIPNYGPYKNLKKSICMKKMLGEKNETV